MATAERTTPLPVEQEARPRPQLALAPAPGPEREALRFYLRVRTRFLVTVVCSLAWAAFSLWISQPWIAALADALSLPAAIAIVLGIAVIPGYLNMQLVTSILLDRPRLLRFDHDFPAVTLLIAAYNEQQAIADTVEYALRSDYPGRFDVVVVDDGSTDRTRDVVRAIARRDSRVCLVKGAHGGKARALNLALERIETPLVATIDADTLLMPWSLKHGVARYLQSPPDTVAVAGSVLARNSRSNLLARMQEWDYFLAIASVKRQQALLQGTLVAQGAFSIYRTEALKDVGGWPDRIGEDIVLTWAMLRRGGRTTFEPTAIAFTEVPERLRHFFRQRQRWARGMIEGLRDHGSTLVMRRRLLAHSIAVNYLFPFLDGMYTVAFLPGVILALTGNFMIVGPMTVAVLPLNIAIAYAMLYRQRGVFRQTGLRIRKNYGGFLCYMLLYAPIMSPVSFVGYLKELTGAQRRWK
jgi:biofilm PGA synthesis N-glycosyltransferase PgaC